MSAVNNNKRIAKNTLYMYIRMGIIMLVQLYTSRVILNTLGVEDYGIYNIVGAFIVAFTFISGPLGSAVQRFYSFEIGRNNQEELNKVFNISILMYVFVATLLFVILEYCGVWYINHKMNLPDGRLDATLFAFQFSLLALVGSLLKTPFESLVIAHEKMSYYAVVSIVEASLKLLNAFSLVWFGFDKLKLYSVNQFLIVVVICICLLIYTHKQFQHVKLKPTWNYTVFKSLLSFSGWTLFSSLSTMGANQGVNMVVNLYAGVTVNAAMGIANQVSATINQFVTNFQVAFNPQIVKCYALKDLDAMHILIMRASKISYLLLFALVCPLWFNIDYVLEAWLKTPPAYTGVFCVYLMVWALLESLMAPLWTSITATGKIKTYNIVTSVVISFVFICSWICLYIGCSPVSVMIVKCLIDVVLFAIRLMFTNNLIQLSIKKYLSKVLLPVVAISSIFVIGMAYPASLLQVGFLKLLICYVCFEILYISCVYKYALTMAERTAISNLIKDTIKKYK